MTNKYSLKIKERGRFLFFCLLCYSLLASHIFPAEASRKEKRNEILAIGSSIIRNNNLAIAKENAISEALRKGTEDYLVRRLGNGDMVNNFHRIVNEIIPSTKEEIENFHILAEDMTGDKYRILVRLRINKAVMDERLRRAGLLIMQGPALKVLFLIVEKSGEQIDYWWKDPGVPSAMSSIELALYKIFQERGYRPINRRSTIQQFELSEDHRSPDLTNEAILTWGKLFFADVAIYGKAELIENEEISMVLKAFDTNKDMFICRGMRIEPIQKDPQGNSLKIETVENLINNLAAKLTPAIIKTAGSSTEKTRILDVTLSNLKTYRQFMDFRNFLKKNLAGVKSVKQTRAARDSISIEIQFEGDETKFIENVQNHENLPFLLDYSLTEDGTILIEVK